jgi:hypothetical protein
MAEAAAPSLRRRAGVSFRSDLGLELYRQHTLLSIMAARMRESADGVVRRKRIDPTRLRRALDVHQGYLLDVHQENERRVLEALEGSTDPKVIKSIEECRVEHEKSRRFQVEARRFLSEGAEEDASVSRLAKLLRSEASHIEDHHAHEEQQLYRNLDRLLAANVLDSLLREIRQFDNRRINAEIALSSWASELSPSSD